MVRILTANPFRNRNEPTKPREPNDHAEHMHGHSISANVTGSFDASVIRWVAVVAAVEQVVVGDGALVGDAVPELNRILEIAHAPGLTIGCGCVGAKE